MSNSPLSSAALPRLHPRHAVAALLLVLAVALVWRWWLAPVAAPAALAPSSAATPLTPVADALANGDVERARTMLGTIDANGTPVLPLEKAIIQQEITLQDIAAQLNIPNEAIAAMPAEKKTELVQQIEDAYQAYPANVAFAALALQAVPMLDAAAAPALVRTVLAANPGHLPLRLAAAQAYEAAGSTADAIALYTDILATHPGQILAQRRLAALQPSASVAASSATTSSSSPNQP